MTRRVRMLLSIIAAAAVVLTPGLPRAQEDTGGGDTAAVAVNTKDGTTVFRFSFQVIRVTREVVDNQNAAVAFASCVDCSAIAISFQVVLSFDDPSVVSPENYAIAINFECTDCETLASAYQYVLGTDGAVHFTPEGNRALASIRQQFTVLMRQADQMTIEEIQAELDLLATQLAELLANELVAAAPPGDVTIAPAEEGEATTGTTEAPSPTPSESSSPTTDPVETPTEDPSPTGSPTETPSAVPTTSPTG